jgi:predicted acylesterase/phospholipase RssA
MKFLTSFVPHDIFMMLETSCIMMQLEKKDCKNDCNEPTDISETIPSTIPSTIPDPIPSLPETNEQQSQQSQQAQQPSTPIETVISIPPPPPIQRPLRRHSHMPVPTTCSPQTILDNITYPSPHLQPPASTKLPALCPNGWIYDIEYITFSGGGAKGYMLAGALLALDEALLAKKHNLFNQLKGASGTSIGAVFALLAVLGVRNNMLRKTVLHTDFSHVVMDVKIEHLVSMYGLNTMLRIKQLVFDIIEREAGRGAHTFQSLFELTGKTLVVCVTNLSRNKAEYHSHLTTPHLTVYESVTASMCIPLLFAPVILNGSWYVDGGLTDNCPFCVFPTDRTFIISIESPLPDMSTLQGYVLRLIQVMLQTGSRNQWNSLTPEHQKRQLVLQNTQVAYTDFQLSHDLKVKLMEDGRKAMLDFLQPDQLVRRYVRSMTQALWWQMFRRPAVL